MMMLKFATQITYFHLSRDASLKWSNFRTAQHYANPNSCRMTFPPALHNPKKNWKKFPQQLPAVHLPFLNNFQYAKQGGLPTNNKWSQS